MNTLLSITSGQELHNTKSVKVSAFLTPNSLRGQTFQESFLSLAVRPNPAVRGLVQKVGASRKVPAVNGHTFARGTWVTDDYTLENDTIIKVFVHRETGNGSPKIQNSFYLKMRDTAALCKINLSLLGLVNSAKTSLEIMGRFDIIKNTSDALEAGVTNIQPHLARFCAEHQYNRYCTEEIIAAEVAPVQVVERRVIQAVTDEGEVKEISVVRNRKKRVLDI